MTLADAAARNRHVKPGLTLVWLACTACALSAGGPRTPAITLLKEQRQAMGTEVEFTLRGPATKAGRAAIDAAYAEMLRLEQRMTSWTHPGWPASDVTRINLGAGDADWIAVAPETFAVLALAQQVARASDGAFDITYAPLRTAWHFDEDADNTVPDAALVAARRAYVGFDGLELDPASHGARLRHKGMRIDLGGIAKGAIVDAAVRVLRAHGFRDFIVQAGGDMYVSGRRGERPWQVGIRDPRNIGDYFASLAVEDHAFSTAGDYERGFEQAGRRYHHILDPRTGWPADASRSVTLYAPSALLADALDNAVFVLGPQAGLALLRRYPGCEAVIVDGQGAIVVSEGLRESVRYQSEPR